MSTKKLVYTYVLKDLKEKIYKIGKTTSPHQRFKSLCIRNEVIPIALISRDIESDLHFMYRQNRIQHPRYKGNGGTEWFKPGGKFDEFIEKVDKGRVIPYITLTEMVRELHKSRVLEVDDPIALWEINQNDYSLYNIAIEILKMLGYISPEGFNLINQDTKNILLIGKKVTISEEVINNIKNNYKIYISYSLSNPFIRKNIDKKRLNSRGRKVLLDKEDSDSVIFLLLNRVL